MAIKIIIFDLDGTLVDSSVDICHAINYAIEGTGIKPVSVERTIQLIGEGISRLFEKLVEAEKSDADRDMLAARFMEHYNAHLTDNTPLYPGVKDTLESLKEYRKVIITNKRQDASAKILDTLGIAKYFDFIAGSDTTPGKKPSPIPIQFVLEKYGLKPDDAVIIGDSNFDVEAGKAAGIKTIAVTYGYRPLEALKQADFIVNSMPEVIPIINLLLGDEGGWVDE
jgi:phosphoglycolate phosphatase